MPEPVTRLLLVLAILVLGIQIGAAVYEMVVITPIWAGNPPASVRGWNAVPALAIQPFEYKLPAIAALFSTSLLLFAASFNKPQWRGWVFVSAVLCTGVVLATIFYFFPVLQTMITERGASLTDAEIITQVTEWRHWSRVRLAVLCVAWICAVVGLLQAPTRARMFGSDVRWR